MYQVLLCVDIDHNVVSMKAFFATITVFYFFRYSWVSGIYSIHHPFIWACCLRFIHSTAIQQRLVSTDLICHEKFEVGTGWYVGEQSHSWVGFQLE